MSGFCVSGCRNSHEVLQAKDVSFAATSVSSVCFEANYARGRLSYRQACGLCQP
jgi:hypothetical protein